MSKPLTPQLRFKGFSEEWGKYSLAQLGEVKMCKRILKSQTSETGEVPFFKIGTFGKTPDAFISRDLFDEYSRIYSYPNVGDIIISAAGTIGRTVVFDGKPAYFQDSNLIWIDNDNSLVHNEYLAAVLPIINWATSSTTIARIYNDTVRKTLFYAPIFKDEQLKIGKYLRSIDKLIAEAEREVERLEKMKVASLQKMFPRPGSTTPQIRFKGFTEDWNLKAIGELFSEGTARGCCGLPLSVSILRGVYPTEDFIKTITVKDFSNYKIVEIGDIVYNSMRMWQGASGVSYWSGYVSPAYTILRPNGEHLCSEFFAYLFKLDWVIKLFEANSQGLTKDTWNLKYPAISLIELPIPADPKEQAIIAKYFRNLDSLIAAKRQKLAKLRNIKASCLDKMFVNSADL